MVNVELTVAPSAVLSLTPPFVLMVPSGLCIYNSRPPCVVRYDPSGLIATNGAGEDGLDTDDGGNVVEKG